MTTPDLKKPAGELADVKRYSFVVRCRESDWPELKQVDDSGGQWVRYSDYTTLAQEVETLREQLRTYRSGGAEGARLKRARQETLEEAAKLLEADIGHPDGPKRPEFYAADIRALQHTGEETKP